MKAATHPYTGSPPGNCIMCDQVQLREDIYPLLGCLTIGRQTTIGDRMSHTALRAAFKHVSSIEMGLPSRLVLLALSNRHNQETGRCDPSIATICADTQLSERAVRNALRELEALKVISTTERRRRYGSKRTNLTNRYRLKGGAQYAGRGGHNMPPKQEYTRVSAFDDLAMLLEDDE